MALVYRKIFDRFPVALKRRINPLEYAIEAFVASASSAQGGRVVLDAGAGEAGNRERFSSDHYVALDSGVGDVSWDYSRVSLLADLEAIPLASGSVDIVIHTQVLEHLPSPGDVLGELYRVLKPGGRLYLTAPQGWPEHQQPQDYFRFTRFSLRQMLQEAGYRDIEIDPMGGYFHFLGHRLTFVPKVLFSERKGLLRVVLSPFELLSLGLFCFLLPLACFYMDRFDAKKEFTLGYQCLARK